LKVAAKDGVALKPKIDEYLTRHRVEFELRSATHEEVCYEVKLPYDKKTDRLSNGILRVGGGNATGVQWDEKKEKK
jgi:hypothetical protein